MPSPCPIPPELWGMQRGTITFIQEKVSRDNSRCFSPFFPPVFPSLSEWIPNLLLPFYVGKANQVGSGRCSRDQPCFRQGKKGSFSQQIPALLEPVPGSSKVWLSSGSGCSLQNTCPLQKPPKFYIMVPFTGLT